MKVLSVCLLLTVAFALASAKSYRNHKVVTFTIENEEQLKEMQAIEGDSGVRRTKLVLLTLK